ncbi:hypothetical protein CPSG_09491 [Coccidioides posadasii str. Silveira]|uniref:Uncharacterized protein n=1 Tax=Coccidioides posadasii (strain RMSCC 757 / Silveira) TaxID=443226 RepID=E9DI42_COCPS|nr:hypothetical protein CPSG_09491 [Coccidioides posadasii str. Silveira]
MNALVSPIPSSPSSFLSLSLLSFLTSSLLLIFPFVSCSCLTQHFVTHFDSLRHCFLHSNHSFRSSSGKFHITMLPFALLALSRHSGIS